ncbi:MAG: glutamate-5-semialdehyde dehydrogenase [Clostridia bacterium]|nr:glutamate-5-semialdehyde dehydrogenase [Clostridia bacterium]
MLEQMGKNAKSASRVLGRLSTKEKNEALNNIAKELMLQRDKILAANAEDIKKAKDNGISDVMIDRLMLNDKRIESMCSAIGELIALDDPVGEVISMTKRPNGLLIGQKRVPLGVVAIIFESRPNVSVDAATICLKTSNAVILRGGKEAINSNIALSEAMRDALEKSGLPRDAVQLIHDTNRETATKLMRLNKYVDVLIPRGGAGLIRAVVDNANVPVIETGVGNCHVFIDESADIDMAVKIVDNAKTQRPSVCNAIENLLVHESIAEKALPPVYERLKEHSVEIRGCEKTRAVIKDAKPATDEDYYTEFLDYILAVKVVSGVDEAIEHINKYGSGHSEAIITESYKNSQKFLELIDAAAVYVNASTRFTDGGEFGLGAEMGISTQKLHARGPMGLCAMTSTKFIIYGDGQTR